MTVNWQVGDGGRIGDAEFVVLALASIGKPSKVVAITIKFAPDSDVFQRVAWDHVGIDLLAAMGAVRLPPPVPPTIGHPQSVKDNPPPKGEVVLAWCESEWVAVGQPSTLFEWWMPQPAPPPGVAK